MTATTPARHVLVVDDDRALRYAITALLQGAGYSTDQAGDGPEALDKLRQQPVDLMLLDIGLPGMSGLDVCRRLRSEGSRIPIIMLTAKSDTIDVVVGLELGADDYVTKPFEVRRSEERRVGKEC